MEVTTAARVAAGWVLGLSVERESEEKMSWGRNRIKTIDGCGRATKPRRTKIVEECAFEPSHLLI